MNSSKDLIADLIETTRHLSKVNADLMDRLTTLQYAYDHTRRREAEIRTELIELKKSRDE